MTCTADLVMAVNRILFGCDFSKLIVQRDNPVMQLKCHFVVNGGNIGKIANAMQLQMQRWHTLHIPARELPVPVFMTYKCQYLNSRPIS